MDFIGITERGDAALDDSWKKWVYDKNLPAILITKNAPLLERNYPDIFTKNIIIHATCTGLGGSFIEPQVPYFEKILEWIDKRNDDELKRIVLRIDPFCPSFFSSKEVNYDDALCQIFNYAATKNLRVRTSFLDCYPHVLQRFENSIEIEENLKSDYKGQIHLSIEIRNRWLSFLKEFWPEIDLEICGEPDMKCTGCVSQKDLDLFGMEEITIEEKGQRSYCSCLANKKELLDNKHQCKHGCLYCYWRN